MPDEIVEVAQEDLLYLVKLADWCAGQGFCGIDDLKDPDEWCYDKWRALGTEDGSGYSAEALAGALAATADLKASNAALVEALRKISAHSYGLQSLMEDYGSDPNSYNYHAMNYWQTDANRLRSIARTALQAYADGEKVA